MFSSAQGYGLVFPGGLAGQLPWLTSLLFGELIKHICAPDCLARQSCQFVSARWAEVLAGLSA